MPKPLGSSERRSNEHRRSVRYPEPVSWSGRSGPTASPSSPPGRGRSPSRALSSAGIPVPDVLVTAENVDDGKPDPAGYLRAASLLGVEPADSVVLEDAPVGVEAGLAAGMTVIAVLTTSEESALRDAHRRVADLRELLPESDGELRLRGRDSNPNFLVQSQASCR